MAPRAGALQNRGGKGDGKGGGKGGDKKGAATAESVVWFCSSCGTVHNGGETRCRKCRAAKPPKVPPSPIKTRHTDFTRTPQQQLRRQQSAGLSGQAPAWGASKGPNAILTAAVSSLTPACGSLKADVVGLLAAYAPDQPRVRDLWARCRDDAKKEVEAAETKLEQRDRAVQNLEAQLGQAKRSRMAKAALQVYYVLVIIEIIITSTAGD